MPFLPLLALAVPLQRGASSSSAVEATVRPQFVSTDYFRKTDPEILGRLKTLRLPAGRTFLLPWERGLRFTPLPDLTLNPPSPPPSGSGGTGVPKPGEVVIGKGGVFKIPKTDYGDLPGALEQKSYSADYGTVPAGGKPVTGWYYGTATKAGVMEVSLPKGAPIAIDRAETFTGELKDGKPTVESTITPSNVTASKPMKVAVASGQSYRIGYTLQATDLKPGVLKGTSSVIDGARTTIHFKGNVVAPKTFVAIDYDTEPLVVKSGSYSSRLLTLTLQSSQSAKPVLKFKALNASALADQGITVEPTWDVGFGNGKKQTVYIRIKAGYDALDVKDTAQIEVQDGLGTPIATIPIAFEAYSPWVTSVISLNKGGLYFQGGFSYNSTGAYDFKGWFTALDGKPHHCYGFAALATKVDGKSYGIAVNGDVVPEKKVLSFSRTGVSKLIRENFKALSAGDVLSAMAEEQLWIDSSKKKHDFASLKNDG